MTAQEAYILAKAYTNKSIEGAGSLKGAACQIKSIEEITGGHRITFEWEDNDGEVSTDTMDVMDGADGSDGVGISSITYKETDAHGNYVYTVTLTDTNTYDIICPKGAQGETGATGATGNGIASIEKTSTAGLVDTYTITYTNGQTTTFTVTNGESITVDSAMSGSSTNPVQNKVITEALADKQDAEDNNLTTTSKTVVGAVNELKSGLTTLDNEVNGDATVYPYADVITIEDAVPANVADCSVKIEPVQDLHGQSAPYVGGAGKNKLPLTVDGIKEANTSGTWSGNTYTLNGVSFSVNTDDSDNVISIKVTGNLNASSSSMNIATMQAQSDPVIMNGCPSGGGSSTYRLNWAGNGNDNGNGVTIQTPVTGNVMIAIYSLATGDELTFQPMIRLSTETDATFAPYTNICPITGHTEASVQRDGVNLCPDKTYKQNLYTIYIGQDEGSSFPFHLTGGTTYTLSYVTQLSPVIIYLRKDGDSSGVIVNSTFTPSETANYRIALTIEGIDSSNVTNIQLEIGEVAHAYVPHVPTQTYTIALGDTIYGGTVDFNTGVMTVDRAIVDLGDIEWAYNSDGFFYTANPSGMKQPATASDKPNWMLTCYDAVSYNSFVSVYANGTAAEGNGYTRIANTAYTDATDFKTAMTGQKLVYELATPFTIQLTAQQIQLLKGTNTITASTGQISVTVNGVSGSIGAVQEQVNELADEVTVTKELRYTGTGTVPNTIDFGNDTPKRIIGIIPDPDEEFVLSNYEAVGEISWGMLLALSYWSTQSGGVPTTNNGGTNLIRMSFSGNTVTLSAGNAAQIANYSGQKYLVKYEA